MLPSQGLFQQPDNRSTATREPLNFTMWPSPAGANKAPAGRPQPACGSI